MATKPIPICGEHHVLKQWRATTFEYTDAGITIRVPNIYAWVCPESGEAAFPPERVDVLLSTVRDLREAAKRARERRSMPNEYSIFVGPSFQLETAAS